jgi:hypothetical protein
MFVLGAMAATWVEVTMKRPALAAVRPGATRRR